MALKIIKGDIHWLIFYFFVSLSWLFILLTRKNYSETQLLESLYGAEFWIELCGKANGFEDIFSLFMMWVLMSGAMMMPTLVPTLRTYQDLIYSGAGTPIGFLLIIFGFLIVWVGYSVLIAILQAVLLEQRFINSNGQLTSSVVSTFLLLSAGFYQFSKLKNSCASKCRAPLAFFMEFWAPGQVQCFKMGLRLGLSCLGCCWVLMLLAFVGGTMSLAFMGLATVIMILEKLPKLGDYISKPLGYVLIATAGLNLLI
ncbi:MAG: DUF2182 domain-containing protein [Paracoccaceae bacterium]|nr:DUF2182 domain-containing protein [Paracoccaceae bacterium]